MNSLMVEIFPHDGPNRGTAHLSTFRHQMAVPSTGDLVYVGIYLYRVDHLTWVYGGMSGTDYEAVTRVVVHVYLAFPEKKKRRWKK